MDDNQMKSHVWSHGIPFVDERYQVQVGLPAFLHQEKRHDIINVYKIFIRVVISRMSGIFWVRFIKLVCPL